MSRPEDQAWRDIIDNFGERADLGDGGPADLPDFEEHEEPAVEPDRESWTPAWDDEGHFEPPTVEPLPTGTPAQRLAWAGVLGLPALAIVLYTVTAIGHWTLPGWLSFAMVAAFVGSFVFLVRGMRKHPDDGWDDGARL